MGIGAAVIGAPVIGGAGTVNSPPSVTSVAATTTANTGARSTVSWLYSQPQGRPQASYRVRAQDSGGSTTYFDSGWLNGADTAYTFDIDEAGVPTNGSTIRWVVGARDTFGGVSSDATGNATYSWGNPQCTISTIEGVAPVSARVTVTTANDVTVGWSFADGSNTQSAYRLILRQAATDFVLFDSGWVASTATSADIPYILTNGSSYEVLVELKNNYGVRSD